MKKFLISITIIAFILPIPFALCTGSDDFIFIQGDPHYINHFPDPVNLRTGNLYLPSLDIDIKASNVRLKIERSYNSFLSNRKGPLGYGWRHNYQTVIKEMGGGKINISEFDGFVTGFNMTEELKKKMARKVYNARQSFEESKGRKKTAEFYKKFRDKMEDKPSYLFEMIKNYLPKLKTAPEGTYYSLARKGQILVKSKDGYMRRYYDGKKDYFNKEGQIIKTEDRNGNYIGFKYKNDKLIGIFDRNNLTLSLRYNSDGNISEIKDPAGRIFKYFYDRPGNLSRTLGFGGEKESFYYNKIHKLTRVVLANGSRVEIKYDSRNRVSAQLGPGQKKAVYSYDKEGGVLTGSVTDARGNKRSFKFKNKEGEIVEITPEGSSKTNVYNPATGKLSKTIDERGKTTNFAYNKSGDLVKILNPLGYTTTFTYGPFGNMTSQAHGGAVTNYTYDKRGNLISKILPTGEKFSYRYDRYGNMIRIINPDGSLISMRYDKYGNIRQIIDPLKNRTRFDVDILGRITQQTDPLGRTSRVEYDSSGNTTVIRDELGQTIKVKYSKDDKPVEITDPRGARTIYSYNSMGLVEKETNPLGLSKLYQYDKAGNPIKITDFDGTSYIYEYDKSGRMTKMTWPGGFNIYKYDPAGNLTSIKDNVGNTHLYSYDAIGRLTRIVLPDKTTESFTYGFDAVTKKDRLGNKTITKFDKIGRTIEFTDAKGIKTSFRYDHRSKLTEKKTSAGEHYKYAYDSLGRLVETKLNGKLINMATYDARGNLVELMGRSGIKSKFKYDAAGRLIMSQNPLTGTRKFTYNSQGYVTSKTDPNGRTEIYRYNQIGQLVSLKRPDGIVESYDYDKYGRLNSISSPAASTAFTYDESGNIVKVSDGKNTVASYEYDNAGRIIEARNSYVHYRYGYDNNDRLILEKDVKRNREFTISYNRLGLVSGINDGKKRIRIFKYDKFGRLARITDELKQSYKLLHDRKDRIRQITYPNGMKTRFSYDSMGNVKAMISKGPAGKTLFAAKYQYDISGNLLREVSSNGRKNYLYDDMGRLARADYGKKSFKYEYDNMGNRLKETAGANTKKYAYGPAGKLIKAGKSTLSYDKSGNVIQKKAPGSMMDYRYTSSGQLTKIMKNGKPVLDVKYDPYGRKYSQTKDGKTIYFRYLGLNHIIEEDGKGHAVRSYVHGSDLLQLDAPLAINMEGRSVFPIRDAKGNPVRMASAKGTVVAKFDYEPFGKPYKATSKVSSKPQFASRPYYAEVGLSDFRYRYYDTDTGRFLSKDILSPFSAVNEYVWPGNNPKNRDPLGLVSFGSKSSTPREASPSRSASSAPGYRDPATPGPGITTTTPTDRTGTNPRTTAPQVPQQPRRPSYERSKPDYLKMIFYGTAVPWGVKQLSNLMKKISPKLDFSDVTDNFLDLYSQGSNPVSALMLGITRKVMGVTDKILPGGATGKSSQPVDILDINKNQLKKDLAILSGEQLLEKYPYLEVKWLDKNWLLVYFGEGTPWQFECDDLEKIRKSQPKSNVYYQNNSRTPPDPDRSLNEPSYYNQNDQFQMYQRSRNAGSTRMTTPTMTTPGTTQSGGQRTTQDPRR